MSRPQVVRPPTGMLGWRCKRGDGAFAAPRSRLSGTWRHRMKFGIGQPVRRTEDTRLITGHGQYTDDINLPNQL